jgi:hypothetical protein
MATINYNGMELEEITKPQIFDPPRRCVVFDSYDEKMSVVRNVVAVLPASFNTCGGILSVITEEKQYWKHCALLPDPPKPRRATNRELSRWLAQGNGECLGSQDDADTAWNYPMESSNVPLREGAKVRKWSDTEWHEPDVFYMEIEKEST